MRHCGEKVRGSTAQLHTHGRRCSTTTTGRSISRIMTSSTTASLTGAQASGSPPSSCTCAYLCILIYQTHPARHSAFPHLQCLSKQPWRNPDRQSWLLPGPHQRWVEKQFSHWDGPTREGTAGQNALKSGWRMGVEDLKLQQPRALSHGPETVNPVLQGACCQGDQGGCHILLGAEA
jgi:hypothetical protein